MNYQEWLKKLDNRTLNALRLVLVLSLTLVFGIVLYHRTFNQNPPAVALQKSVALIKPLATVETAPPADGQPTTSTDAGNQLADLETPAVETQEGDSGDYFSDQQPTPQEDHLIAEQEFSAKAIVVLDGKTGNIIFQKNARQKLPMASLTKLMTAVVTLENSDPEAAVLVSETAVGTEGTAGNFRPGEELTVLDLVKTMLVVSSNDAATVLEEYFRSQNGDLVSMMNEKAIEIGMSDTHFSNPAGLDEKDHYSSTYDLAKLASYINQHRSEIVEIISSKKMTVQALNKKITHTLLSTNQLLQEDIPGVRGGKTGYTKNALGCMLTILEDGDIVVVLGSQDRFGETKEIISNLNPAP